jgi:ribosomal protein S18 acetylase RimI-like enzyme
MNIVPFGIDDVVHFLKLAAAENWVAESWEFDFLLSNFSQGCFAARGDKGETVGFVTSLLHNRSGWIGNLIVTPEYRGKGIGERLFSKALDALRSADVETYWLTASQSGRKLYEKYGFRSIDTILRWVGNGQEQHTADDQHGDNDTSILSVGDIDSAAWGDRRHSLLAATAGRGRVLFYKTGFLVIQPGIKAKQFGPFSALDAGGAEQLLESAIRSIESGTIFLVDTPVSNRPAVRLFKQKGMRIAGTNELMYAGKRPDYKPEYIYGLATMGSCG